jgi:hypothetical protein
VLSVLHDAFAGTKEQKTQLSDNYELKHNKNQLSPQKSPHSKVTIKRIALNSIIFLYDKQKPKYYFIESIVFAQ